MKVKCLLLVMLFLSTVGGISLQAMEIPTLSNLSEPSQRHFEDVEAQGPPKVVVADDINRLASAHLSDLMQQLKTMTSSECTKIRSSGVFSEQIGLQPELAPITVVESHVTEARVAEVGVQQVTNPIKREIVNDLETLLRAFPKLEIGIKYVIYKEDSVPEPASCCSRIFGWLTAVNSAINIGASVAREGFQTYSLANPGMDPTVSGGVLIGLSALKLGTSMLQSILAKMRHKKIDSVINKLKLDFQEDETISIKDLNSLVAESFSKIRGIAKKVMTHLNLSQLNADYRAKLGRLILLEKQLSRSARIKSCMLSIEGVSAFSAQMVSSVAVLCSGQESAVSFWSTLSYTGINNAMDRYNVLHAGMPMDQEFIDAAEIFYLSAHLAKAISDKE